MPELPSGPTSMLPNELDFLYVETFRRFVDQFQYPAFIANPLPPISDSNDLEITYFNNELVKAFRVSPEHLDGLTVKGLIRQLRRVAFRPLRKEIVRQQLRKLDRGTKGKMPNVSGGIIVDNRNDPQGNQYDGLVYFNVFGTQLLAQKPRTDHIASIVFYTPTLVESLYDLMATLKVNKEIKYLDLLRRSDKYSIYMPSFEQQRPTSKFEELKNATHTPATNSRWMSRLEGGMISAMKFSSTESMDKAIDLLGRNEFQDMPYELEDSDILLVPTDAIPLFRKYDLAFQDEPA